MDRDGEGKLDQLRLDPAVTELAATALERATCEANPHTRWTDERGCIEKSQV